MKTLLEVTNETLDKANVDMWFKARKEVSNDEDPNGTPARLYQLCWLLAKYTLFVSPIDAATHCFSGGLPGENFADCFPWKNNRKLHGSHAERW